MHLDLSVVPVIDRLGELRAGDRGSSNAFFADPFVREYTAFESFEAFSAASPWTLERPGALDAAPRPELDEYVAETTEFETWEAMKEQAAKEELVVQHVDEVVA